MSFIETIFQQLAAWPTKPLVTEVHGSTKVHAEGTVLADLVSRGRGTLAGRGMKPGDRVVLVAPNSIRWVAADLAILASGGVVVPMYDRQDPVELAGMIADCTPRVVLVADDGIADQLRPHTDAPLLPFTDLFGGQTLQGPPVRRADVDPVTIVYTSGTSGVPKGVVLTVRNVDFMLPRTRDALTAMMGPTDGDDRVFHYLPFCFAGSRVVLWTCLFRGNGIHVSTDLDNLLAEIGAVEPHYFLNVPMLLERIKNGVEAKIAERHPAVRWLYARGLAASLKASPGRRDRFLANITQRVVFRPIRDKIGPSLRCLICGSAPLGEDTQRWFGALGIPVYQVYGLTETTAIVTMDVPPAVVPGRVGSALEGVETKLTAEGELLVRGPNVFPRYWEKPDATAEAFLDGWFRTGDQAEIDDTGTWRIVGRVKNLLVPTSGHNVAPEPIEQKLIETIPGVEQAVVVGHGKPYLAAILSGTPDPAALDEAIADVNRALPHYRRVRKWVVAPDPFTIENGLLTANRKLKRRAIEDAYAETIAALYG